MSAKTIVLTFDDSVANHATFVAPLLKRYHFGASFFICEFPPDFATNKQQYMTWEQIRGLHDAGFEIGNHTLLHSGVLDHTREQILADMKALDDRCAEYGIPATETFAYPGGPCNEAAMTYVAEYGMKWARMVENRPYVHGDHPMRLPSYPVHGDDPQVFYNAVNQADAQSIPILVFHGVPEYTHPWVNTTPERFAEYMAYLAEKQFNVIALRDLKPL